MNERRLPPIIGLPFILAASCVASAPAVDKDAAPDKTPAVSTDDKTPVDDLLVCDCVVFKSRRMGRDTPSILTRSAPFRTTVQECKQRGGRYVLYSASDAKAALDIWMPAAEQGSAEAQYAVGEIYERGLGVEPDHAAAARWYRLAADQGSRPAQNSLGYLYEEGLGVERSPETALQWYRRASGVPDAILLSAPAGGASAVGSLVGGPDIVVIDPPLIGFQGMPVNPESGRIVGRVTAPAGLQELLLLGKAVEVSGLGIFRSPWPEGTDLVSLLAEDRRGMTSRVEINADPGAAGGHSPRTGVAFGRYVAVVIGNSDYTAWPSIPQAKAGAREMARVLESHYGFLVRLLINADRVAVIRTLHELSKGLTEKDNLLIYYAGQGHLEGEWQDGYWLPVDAEPNRRDNWVPISEVIARANMIPARKTLVIADSAFRQARSSSTLPLLTGADAPQEREERLRAAAAGRTLVALTSGEWTQEWETKGTENPVFSRALAEVLETNNDVLETRRLRAEVAARMVLATADDGVFREPQCAGMRGNEGGDFFFVPEQY
jgi:hypothetical protein